MIIPIFCIHVKKSDWNEPSINKVQKINTEQKYFIFPTLTQMLTPRFSCPLIKVT